MSARYATAVRTSTHEYRGVTLEASGEHGAVYLVIGDRHVRQSFLSTNHAIDYGKRRLDALARAAARRAERDANPGVEWCPYPSHAPWAIAWDRERGHDLPTDYETCPFRHGRNPS